MDERRLEQGGAGEILRWRPRDRDAGLVSAVVVRGRRLANKERNGGIVNDEKSTNHGSRAYRYGFIAVQRLAVADAAEGSEGRISAPRIGHNQKSYPHRKYYLKKKQLYGKKTDSPRKVAPSIPLKVTSTLLPTSIESCRSRNGGVTQLDLFHY